MLNKGSDDSQCFLFQRNVILDQSIPFLFSLGVAELFLVVYDLEW